MDSLIVIITLIFFAAGLAYGYGARTIKGSDAVLGAITKSWAGLASLLFLFLLIAQFIAYFNYSQHGARWRPSSSATGSRAPTSAPSGC